MDELELLELCADRPGPTGLNPQAEWYGMGRWLKRYGYYPRMLPVGARAVHGVARNDPIPTDLRAKPLVSFVHNRKAACKWREASFSLCFVVGSPFVHYRKLMGIERNPDARGTVAFPVHSSHHVSVDTDWKRYAHELKGLPAEYQPVTVCLYWRDIQRGVHRVFMDEGLPVVTAGHMFDPGFIERFYDILANHRFATINAITSAGLYAAEMGIPLFLTGRTLDVTAVNERDPNVPIGTFDIRTQSELDGKIRDLFADRTFFVTVEQRAFVEAHLGLSDALARWQLSVVLWATLLVAVPLGIVLRLAVRAGRIWTILTSTKG